MISWCFSCEPQSPIPSLQNEPSVHSDLLIISLINVKLPIRLQEERADIWKTVQFLGGKDPLQLLALDLIDKIKDTAASRTYYIPESVR